MISPITSCGAWPAVVLATLPLTALSEIAAAKEQSPIKLFNGEDLSGWDYHLADDEAEMQDVWSAKNGILTCTGRPAGYFITKQNNFHDYVLSLEWRWHTDQAGNNGVLVHCSEPGALGVWCKSIEVQLAHEHAGDIWVIGTELTVPDVEKRRKGRRHLNLSDGDEKPLGKWNRMDIACRGDEILVRVNGKLVNHATNCSETKGAIALQSEGTPIQYRNIVLRPLKSSGEG